MQGIEDFPGGLIAQFPQALNYLPESLTLSKTGKLPDILQHDSFRPFRLQNPDDIKEQRSPFIISSAHIANDAEWLAGKTGKQEIVIWNIVFIDLRYVSMRFDTEVVLVLHACSFIYLGSKNTLQSKLLSRIVKTPNAAEKIGKSLEPAFSKFIRHDSSDWILDHRSRLFSLKLVFHTGF